MMMRPHRSKCLERSLDLIHALALRREEEEDGECEEGKEESNDIPADDPYTG